MADQASGVDPDFVLGWGNSIIEVGATYLYVVESASIPDRVKIGTAKDPLKRLSEIDISRHSLPLPYDIKHLFLLEDAHQIEKCVQLLLWTRGRWYWGELFDCPADEAAGIIRSVLMRYEDLRSPQKIEQAARILQDIPEPEGDHPACPFEVPRTDPIFAKAHARYARSAARKAKLIESGFTEFYKIAEHRGWYLS